MKISDDGMPQPNAKNAFGFAHLFSAQDFAQRGPLEIVLAGDKLATTAEALIDRCVACRRSRWLFVADAEDGLAD